MLISQAIGLEFNTMNLCKKKKNPDMVVCPCNPSLWEVETRLLGAHWPAPLVKLVNSSHHRPKVTLFPFEGKSQFRWLMWVGPAHGGGGQGLGR